MAGDDKDEDLNISDAEYKAGTEAQKDQEKIPAEEAFKDDHPVPKDEDSVA